MVLPGQSTQTTHLTPEIWLDRESVWLDLARTWEWLDREANINEQEQLREPIPSFAEQVRLNLVVRNWFQRDISLTFSFTQQQPSTPGEWLEDGRRRLVGPGGCPPPGTSHSCPVL